ncbi:4-hydroxy-tetrahydrodipicolinate reductase [Fructilactobacillus florum]|uniref:4-hydroxy-tetrahydrodipicolinate reductase n=1 Tax=Fructilactobacillus florum DSM 22689 = JCM 16035 TaxID=1423745 RepID=A0A0R2CKW2_9LACO|nr:4-hydroxy-tetrahydrodipicolinate reductase [Fructilactobacillus florum]EKK20625.1 Dihydrodipicolinate reductase [Fructilactobacillus florum 2F]KRM92238.1 dihydrodipicolinate reductase [Fructilactobacillus florum DSM 22689 = JCM 16035]
MIKVLVAGFQGAMGQQAVRLIEHDQQLELVAVYSPHATRNASVPTGCQLFTQLTAIQTDAQVWVDFSTPAGATENAKFALAHNLIPIIGTSGLSSETIQALQEFAKTQHQKGLLVPNFGLSAVLLMQFAKQAARYFPDAEIIEMHHADKRDSPSGTAISTAEQIAIGRQGTPFEAPQTTETIPGARGAHYENVPIHAVRLPGYVAHEQVLFGGPGEALTIRQDSFDRSSFMHGLRLALLNTNKLSGFMVGLENVL